MITKNINIDIELEEFSLEEILEELKYRYTKSANAISDNVEKEHFVHSFKKILKCKDGGTWYLTEAEVLEWEKDGSIKSGDVLYRVITYKTY